MNIRNKLKLVKLSDIKPYQRNAKKHSETQIKAIVESLEKYEYYSPIGIDGKNEVVFGHGRLEALKAKGVTDIEVVDLSYLKPNEIKKLRILDNKIVSTDWDAEALQTEIEMIYKNCDVNLEKLQKELNITAQEYDKYIKEAEEPKKENIKSFDKVYFMVSFHPNLFNEVKEIMEKLKSIDGVDVENSINR